MNSLARFNHQPHLYLPHLKGLADDKPIIANQFDDEFEGRSLDAKWTATLAGIASYEFNTTKPSYIWGNFPTSLAEGGNSISLVQSTSVGTDLFSVTAKFSIPLWEGYQTAAIYAYDADETDATRVQFSASTGNDPYGACGYLTGGSWTYTTSLYVKNYSETIYLHFQRNASNIWWGWVSFTGGKGTWFELGTQTKSLTVDHIRILLSVGTSAGQTAFYGGPAGIDWVRKDWLTL